MERNETHSWPIISRHWLSAAFFVCLIGNNFLEVNFSTLWTAVHLVARRHQENVRKRLLNTGVVKSTYTKKNLNILIIWTYFMYILATMER